MKFARGPGPSGAWSVRVGLLVGLLVAGGGSSRALAAGRPAGNAVAHLAGAWQGSLNGVPVTLTLGADGTCRLFGDAGRWRVAGSHLFLTSAEDPQESDFTFQLAGDVLTLSGDELPGPLVLRRGGGAGDDAGAPAAGAPPSDGAGAPGGASGGGQSYTDAASGLGFTIPAGWYLGQKEGDNLLLVSKSEPGLISVRYGAGITVDAARQEIARGIHTPELELAAMGAPSTCRLGRLTGLDVDLAGASAQESDLRGHLWVAFSPAGAAYVMGLTTTASYAVNRARAEAVARSLTFGRATAAAGGGGASSLAGNYVYMSSSGYGGSGGYSNSQSIDLCRDGSFTMSGESSYSGQMSDAGGNQTGAWGAGSSGSRTGRWSATGDGRAGVITLRFDDGHQEQYEYQVSSNPADRSYYGAALIVDGRSYQKNGDGSCGR